MHWAAWHGNAEMVNLLISHRAPLEDDHNDFDCTPLAWAMHGSENGWHRASGNYPAVAESLLKAGAKIPDRTDGTAEIRAVLDAAKQKG